MDKVMYFSTDNCAPCRTLKPIAQALSSETSIPIEYVDAKQQSHLAQSYSIMQVPTLLRFKNGMLIKRHTGMASKEQLRDLFI
jgi:thioredoxin 1